MLFQRCPAGERTQAFVKSMFIRSKNLHGFALSFIYQRIEDIHKLMSVTENLHGMLQCLAKTAIGTGPFALSGFRNHDIVEICGYFWPLDPAEIGISNDP